MRKNFWLLLTTAALTMSVACSDDDTPRDPEGTVALNMHDEDNGKTLLGTSEIYIDNGQNFVAGSDCRLFTVGKRGSLSAISPDSFENPVPRVAVQADCGYFAVRPKALCSFPSGAQALPIDGSVDYIRFCVVSPLTQGDRTIGAAVKYQIADPEHYGLPEFGSTVLDFDCSSYNGERKSVTLPTADFEYDFNDYGGSFECTKEGRKLHFRLIDSGSAATRYSLWIRIRGSYTRVYVAVRE